eukprot:TRINITY_DN3639_c0_g1_i4.p1 TRINITY_DN3639_c0_g1~~TRINITY_DN3639_c0_g1_i4.p1  ORF type:complete len:228 (+),score=39.75 TRINITY_DN3639_c0_g1_i4:28-684(+)
MSASSIVLHGDSLLISPYVFAAYISLKEVGVPFSIVRWDLENLKNNREPAYAMKSITGRVPSIEHGEFVLAESAAIAEYLDEAFGPRKLFPDDIHHRARARQVMGWVRSSLPDLRNERSTYTMFCKKATNPLSEKALADADKLIRVADGLIPSDSGSMFGGRWSISDADLTFMLCRLHMNEHPLPDKVRIYVERQLERPSLKEFWGVDRTHDSYSIVP